DRTIGCGVPCRDREEPRSPRCILHSRSILRLGAARLRNALRVCDRVTLDAVDCHFEFGWSRAQRGDAISKSNITSPYGASQSRADKGIRLALLASALLAVSPRALRRFACPPDWLFAVATV